MESPFILIAFLSMISATMGWMLTRIIQANDERMKKLESKIESLAESVNLELKVIRTQNYTDKREIIDSVHSLEKKIVEIKAENEARKTLSEIKLVRKESLTFTINGEKNGCQEKKKSCWFFNERNHGKVWLFF